MAANGSTPIREVPRMITIRRDSEIFDTEGGWFRARWHFSFDRYRDPENDAFGAMRVFNDDRLVPGAVWPLHPHRDVEGLTYVVEGQLRAPGQRRRRRMVRCRRARSSA